MEQLFFVFLLIIVIFLFYKQENVDKKYEEKINKILAEKINQLNLIIKNNKVKDFAEKRINDPLLPPEIRGPFPINDIPLVKINQNPRGESLDPEYLSYQQVGFLMNNDESDPTILPLFGKKKFPRSDRWEYYYQTDKYNQIKIPIAYKKNYPLMSKDNINIPEYKKDFTVTIYEYDTPKYIPHII